MDNYVGKRLDGRYEIREIIGVGGMAVVYKAYDNIDDRIVSIKILKDEFLANEEFRRRFKNESKAIAVLSHPNIVKVYDVSLGDKLQYIVMEYVEGITLKEYIEQQKVIDWKEAVHFATQILRALQHAHDKGIVHRDIKPQNILLLENGTIKVTDFGIARFSRGETRTMTEAAIGSVHYISPEQARGEVTDDKADIYSVGVVLYEMITGQLPFESDSAVSVALMQVQNEATPPRQINPDLPVGLEQITMHAMEKNTRNRYQSAAEMLLDLDELKRTPSIKFDYTYHVDKEPTRFISRDEVTGGISASVPSDQRGRSGAGPSGSRKTYGDDERRGHGKSIVVGAVVAILVALALILLFLGLFTDVLSKDRIEVPKFLGMDYEKEIENNEKYTDDFEFDVTYVTNSTYEEGEVCKQSPSGGEKVKRGAKISLEVVSTGATEKIPEIYGLPASTAESMLKEAGFIKINRKEEYDKNAEPGTVIRSDPKEGEEAAVAETVVLYVATSDSGNRSRVPDLTGLNWLSDKNAVINILDQVGLSIGSVTEEDSNEAKGIIIGQTPSGGTEVKNGSAVNITVSSGSPVKTSATVSFTLPNTGASRNVRVYLGTECILDKYVNCDGSTMSVQVSGEGGNVPVSVYAGLTEIYSCSVDFTKDPPVISNERSNVDVDDEEEDDGGNGGGGLIPGLFQ